MKIAIVDNFVDSSNAHGGFHQLLVKHLCHEHQITVLAHEFDAIGTTGVEFMRLPVLFRRPLVLLALSFRLTARISLWWRQKVKGQHFDLVQSVEGNLGVGSVSYAHFCHRHFLRHEWPRAVQGHRNLRSFFRGWDHRVRAWFESSTYHKVSHVVVTSRGLRKELEANYPVVREKIRIIPPPIKVERMSRPPDFARTLFREKLGASPAATIFVFVALGHFERKGLPLLMEALQLVSRTDSSGGVGAAQVWVVGGQSDLIRSYQEKCRVMGITGSVEFCGMQRDIRPYLWAADAFMLPSYYEVFPTVALEAAAAGLPVLSTPLNGVEEFLQDGRNGLLMERTAAGVAQGVHRFLSLTMQQRYAMGLQACESVRPYSLENFLAAWRDFYRQIGQGQPAPQSTGTTDAVSPIAKLSRNG